MCTGLASLSSSEYVRVREETGRGAHKPSLSPQSLHTTHTYSCPRFDSHDDHLQREQCFGLAQPSDGLELELVVPPQGARMATTSGSEMGAESAVALQLQQLSSPGGGGGSPGGISGSPGAGGVSPGGHVFQQSMSRD